MDSSVNRAFAAVPTGATVLGRFIDDSPAIIERSVGRGRVVAFASDPMAPESLDQPLDLVTFVAALQQWSGGRVGDPAWTYGLPGTRRPLPWKGAYAP